MSERDDSRNAARETAWNSTSPRHFATVALLALANYQESGLVGPREGMHGQLVKRMARVAAENRWES